MKGKKMKKNESPGSTDYMLRKKMALFSLSSLEATQENKACSYMQCKERKWTT